MADYWLCPGWLGRRSENKGFAARLAFDGHLPSEAQRIEAARQIRELVPEAKIIFLSSNMHPDVAEAALNAGGLGCIPKWNVAECLVPGIESVLAGQPFILFE